MSNGLDSTSPGDKRRRGSDAELLNLTARRSRRSSLFDAGILDQIDENTHAFSDSSDGDDDQDDDNDYESQSSTTTDREDGILRFSTPTINSPRFNAASLSPVPYTSSPLSKNTSLRPILTESPAYKLRKSKPYDQLQDVDIKQAKLHRIYSENETNKFNSYNGRRMYDDDKYRPHRIKRSIQTNSPVASPISRFTAARSFTISNFQPDHEQSLTSAPIGLTGMEDEYIPDFDFGVAVSQWNDSYYQQQNEADSSIDSASIIDSRPSSLSRPGTPMGETHSQVQPVSVPIKKEHRFGEGLDSEEEMIASKLPQNFGDLPFSVRRKVLADLSPLANSDLISRVIKKKFKKKPKSSPALQFLSSFSERASKISDEGTVILDHTLGKIIGFGAWGIIRECRAANGDVKAIKIIRTKSESGRDFFKRELSIWRDLKHQYILPLLNTKEDDETLFCLTNKITGGTLFDLVSKWGVYNSASHPITTEQRLRIVKRYSLEIISGLMYMHSRGIVHGDVKLENVLIDLSSAGSKALVCDFGMSLRFKSPQDSEDIILENNNIKIKRRPSIPRSLSGDLLTSPKSIQNILNNKQLVHDDTRLNVHLQQAPKDSSKKFVAKPIEFQTDKSDDRSLPHSHIGSLPYAAPELLESSPPPLGPAADVWAFGIMLYTMIVGKLPFQHNYEPRLRAMISSGKYDVESLELASKGNENLIRAVKGSLTVDLTKRLELNEVHDIIKSANI